jgi:mannan endo-1,4-beta-mannosidase
MRLGIVIITALLLVSAPIGWTQSNPNSRPQPTSPAPVNPHATSEARALLQFLDSIGGQYTLTGQHNFPNDGSRWTDRVYDLTAKYPALFGEDFGFSAGEDKDSVESRPAMIAEVKRQYEHGAVIALTWHAVKPTEDEPVTFHDSVQGHLTDFEWRELLTPGTALNLRWQAQVDVIAGYLRQLRDAHVPVLFRPYHEINGNWFWWDGRPGPDGSAALYRQIYDRFVNVHHLDNLLWVWNVNAPGGNAGSIADYYPGAAYADILTIDIYGEFKQDYYTEMLKVAAGKPIALGEVGTVPTPEILATQPRYAYFMAWSGFGANTDVAALNATYHSPHVLNRDDAPIAQPFADIRKATAETKPEKPSGEPVTPSATEPAKALLTRLYRVSNSQTLSGQQNGLPKAIAGKRPAIYSVELASFKAMGIEPGIARRAIEAEAISQFHDGAVISLFWRPTSPTGPELADEASRHIQLTDFEWNELLTAGTNLNKRWIAQVDAIAITLKRLQDAGVPVLWQPYPEANSKSFWWSGRKGIHGSSALYRQLFDRLVNHDGLHNLIWVWDAAPLSFGPNSPGSMSDFFPGLLYVDALSIEISGQGGNRFRADSMLSQISVGKVIGVNFQGKLPPPAFFTQQPDWAWFVVSSDTSQAPDQTDALHQLYADPRIISLPATDAPQ